MLGDDAGFKVNLFKHQLALPGDNFRYANPNWPHKHCSDNHKVQRTMSFGMCWENHDGSALSSENLADKTLNDYWSVYEDALVKPESFD